MNVRRISFLLSLILVSLLACAQAKRPITETDLYRFVWIGNPQLSPDGTRVAFVRVSVNEKKTGYDTAIWSVSTAGSEAPRRMTSGSHDSTPRWSPDGSKLLFLRAVEKDGKPQPPQLAILPMNGGEAWIVSNLPKGAGSPAWSPDGRTILFTSSTSADDIAKAKQSEAKPEGKPEPSQKNPEPPSSTTAGEEHESDVRIVTRAVYRDNDEGYLDPKHHSHIWTIAVPALPDDKPQPKQLTAGDFDEDDPTWSRDGQRIFFTSTRVEEPYYEPITSELYAIPAAGGEITRIAGIKGVIGDFAESPDSRSIAFTGELTQPVLSFVQAKLYVVSTAPNSVPKIIAEKADLDIGDGIGGDQHPPRAGGGRRLFWADNKSVVQIVAEKGSSNLRRFDLASGNVTDVTTGNHDVVAWTTTPDASKLVVNISTPVELGDLYLVGTGGKLTQLTNINQQLWSELNLTPPEEIWYQSFDGKRIQAWVQRPPNFQTGKPYPMILNIHGGPHSAFGYTFFHEMQWMAAKGYVVLYPNPRGSTSYGQEFGNIIQYRYPGDDYKDLMAGVDDLIKRGWADSKKLGVTGGSGGGLLTNWVVTQTDRFQAAVAQRDISDWAAWWYTADFVWFYPRWFKAPPFQDPADYAARSPITHVAKVKTPMMFILGEADSRTPPEAGGEQMFRALKFMRIPTVMALFPGETHELSRSGQPRHRIERLQNIVKWFDIYLQGQPNTYLQPKQESVPKP